LSGVVVWVTGLPRAGKSTLARAARAALDRPTVVLDGDAVRGALVPAPGYDDAAREAFYATLGRLAALVAAQGFVVLVPATAHRRAWRDAARALAPRFIEVYVDTPVEECVGRDEQGLYRGAAALRLPGAGLPYEPPTTPDIVAHGGGDELALRTLVDRLHGLREIAS
jgi:adenylylsulfate kinase